VACLESQAIAEAKVHLELPETQAKKGQKDRKAKKDLQAKERLAPRDQ